jgi:hypothetical protein
LDDSSIDYKYTQEFHNRKIWTDIFLVFSGFFGNGNFKPIGLQGKLQAYYYKPTDYHLWDHEPTDKQILKIIKI